MGRQAKNSTIQAKKCGYGCKDGKIIGLFPVWADEVPQKDRKPVVLIDCPDCKVNIPSGTNES